MARVPPVPIGALPADLRPTYEAFCGSYGNFANQVAVLAHSPSALRHIGGLMMEWRAQGNLSRRVVEVAVVTVSRLNRCPYCIAHHGPVLVEQGLPAEAVEAILEPAPPGFEPLDVLVRDYARLVIERPWGIRDQVFDDLRRSFSDAQIVELTLRISLCNLFNQLNESMQIEVEAGVGP
jgi:uncharacterized peroxidase-related enzyme